MCRVCLTRTHLYSHLHAGLLPWPSGRVPPPTRLHAAGTKILVAGDNFGCGSSREHAPWSISGMGIRCIISSSFADIFHSNCMKNGEMLRGTDWEGGGER